MNNEIIEVVVQNALESLEMSKSFAQNVTYANACALAATLTDIADRRDLRIRNIACDIAVAIARAEFSPELRGELVTIMDHERVTAWYMEVGDGEYVGN